MVEHAKGLFGKEQSKKKGSLNQLLLHEKTAPVWLISLAEIHFILQYKAKRAKNC